MESVSCDETISKNEKLCGDCKTAKTPLWRSGPAGPKSLCNACGIRYRKKRSTVGSDKKKSQTPPPPPPSPSPSQTSSCSSTTAGNRDSYRNKEIEVGGEMKKSDLRIEVVALGKEVVLLQRRRSPVKKIKRRKIENGEVEEAAFVLMSLSCGLVFA